MKPIDVLYLNSFFVIFALLFYAAEYFIPERKINKKVEIKYDLWAFVLLNLSGIFISSPLTQYLLSHPLSYDFFIKTEFSFLKVICATLTLDFFNYWIHFYMHKNNSLWKTHIFHHKIENLYWFSGLRASFTHYLIFILSRVLIGVFFFSLTSKELLFYFSIGLVTNFYQHTNSKTGHRYIEWLIVTPRIHRLHHSEKGRKMVNLSTIFSFWDRMFGTYLSPDDVKEDYKLGIKKINNEIKLNEIIGV